MNYRKNENVCLLFILKSDKENHDFEYTCSFHKKMLPNLKVQSCKLEKY